jgi:hypothetical protein
MSEVRGRKPETEFIKNVGNNSGDCVMLNRVTGRTSE